LRLTFYEGYPEIVRSLTAQLQSLLPEDIPEHVGKVGSLTAQSVSAPDDLLQKLSYTHIEQLLSIRDASKRVFYEVECIRGNWSVRELKRQIGSLYYERSGLSRDKQALSRLANEAAQQASPMLDIRDPYVFEFLGLKPAEVMSESHLEDQILTRLQEFLLELGHGFCFEARQKRILIGDEYFFVDLVLYHRILKCHVLVELKLETFNHANIGQLNTYVSWYQKNVMAEGDNPPIGLLLCSDKNRALVEYALAGMDNQLFVSKYQLELPSKDTIQDFVDQQLKEAELK
jgi:predicted nuclease of restriction endonuclease-like (RecB) superfamily